MFAVSGLYVRCVVQEARYRLRDIGAVCKLQRGLHLVFPDAAGVAKVRHRHVHVVPPDTNLSGTRRHVTRVGHESRVDIISEVRLQGAGIRSGFLRQVHAA